MFPSLPKDATEFKNWSWEQLEPYYHDLLDRDLSAANCSQWLADWSHLAKLVDEAYWRLYVASTLDTTDAQAEGQYTIFLDEVQPHTREADQKVKKKLLASGLSAAGYEIPLRNLRAQAALYRESNLPLLAEDKKLSMDYDRIVGAQTVIWEGRELTIPQLYPVLQETDREKRARAWRLAAERQLADRQAINELWGRMLRLRARIAQNADLPDYRAYRWSELLRFDYTKQDCHRFHLAIEQVVVPAATALYEKRRQRLGLKSLRPWDLDVDPYSRPPQRPYQTIEELESKASAIFHQVDPQLGEYFASMRREKLLDLDNRKGKAPGGYCTAYEAAGVPFIFMNAVGLHDDVQTLLHEGGHAFHVWECRHLAHQQMEVPLEFCEVASMGMELLAAPYLTADKGGFYISQEAARARIETLEFNLRFWPYMAVVDAFQHWVYDEPMQASDPANCDAKWAELWERFMVGVDWSGLEEEKITGWLRKQHIHTDPMYYVEYGLAQLGAAQVWRNALSDQAGSVAAYRRALSLGGTVTVPEMYAAAGAKFAFDAETLGQAVDLMMKTIAELERVQ
jgi:oligoendopeptidase F